MSKIWQSTIDDFLELSAKHKLRMILVGGGAVNFYGYQRHSADVDFWIDTSETNLNKLIAVLSEMNYDIKDFPESVKMQKQNISIKFSPGDLDVELITRFDVNKSFDDAYEASEKVIINEKKVFKYNVLSLDDLIISKLKSARTKDLLDVQELKRINKKKN